MIDQVRRAWGLTVRDSYGQTETTMMIGNSPGQKVVAGSMGRPLPGYPIVLLDADGLESDNGEIALPLRKRPGGLMRGYQNEAGEPAPMDGAYFRTGDVATRDAEGYITYVGRVDDVFKSSDYRLSPFELESALIEHEAVAEVAVVPVPDLVRQTMPKAYVVLAAGFEPNAATAALDLRSRAPSALVLQARAPHRVRGAAQDHIGQDPPGRVARPRERARGRAASGRRASSGSRIFWRGDAFSVRRALASRPFVMKAERNEIIEAFVVLKRAFAASDDLAEELGPRVRLSARHRLCRAASQDPERQDPALPAAQRREGGGR